AHRLTHVRLDPETWEEGCRVWYMGERYPVKKVAAPRNRLRLEGEGFVFECRDEGRFAQTLERFRLAEAKRIFSHRVAYWSQKMGLVPKAVRCRRYKSLWGLCRGDDTLVFNTALLRYDPELIDYVIVHELAHIRHKNHSKAFWALVARYIPDYRHLRSRLV
ncbi:M48 family metallopeptidase, partial [Hydrogenimonas sp.]